MLKLKKTFRFSFWYLTSFVKKNFKLFIISLFSGLIFITSLNSIAPAIQTTFFNQKRVIGIVGQYRLDQLPHKIKSKISNGLVYVNEKGKISPVLINSWEELNQGKEFRLHLKKDLYWNNGQPFTAKDINYRFKDVQTKVIDNYTIIFYLKQKLAIFPNYLSQPIIKPPLNGVAGIYKATTIKFDKEGYLKKIYLSPNKKSLPFIIYRFYRFKKDLINGYKLGEIREFETRDAQITAQFKSWPNTKIKKVIDYSRLMTLFFNLNNQLLKEKDVRQAINFAIPKTKFTNRGLLPLGPIPPLSWAYNPNLKRPTYDQEKAAQIFKKYSSASQPAKLRLSVYYDYAPEAEIIKQSLEKIGIRIQTKYITHFDSNNFDLFLAYWKVPADPDQYYFWHSTQKQGNITHYRNVKVDKLLEDGRNSLNMKERKKNYYKFQEVINEDYPTDFLFYPYLFTIQRK